MNKVTLQKMFIGGDEMPFEKLTARPTANERSLVWEAGGARFMLTENGCVDAMGEEVTPTGNVRLAHPIELDADEILMWRAVLEERGIIQPFVQMREPILLTGGRLGGKDVSGKSAGNEFHMLDRYAGCELPPYAVDALKDEGFRFVTRKAYGSNRIEALNIVTPMGILYKCALPRRTQSLSSASVIMLDMLVPFENVSIRTLNHTAAVLERQLIPSLIGREKLSMLLPHIESADGEELRRLYRLSKRHVRVEEAIACIAKRRRISLK